MPRERCCVLSPRRHQHQELSCKRARDSCCVRARRATEKWVNSVKRSPLDLRARAQIGSWNVHTHMCVYKYMLSIHICCLYNYNAMCPAVDWQRYAARARVISRRRLRTHARTHYFVVYHPSIETCIFHELSTQRKVLICAHTGTITQNANVSAACDVEVAQSK